MIQVQWITFINIIIYFYDKTKINSIHKIMDEDFVILKVILDNLTK